MGITATNDLLPWPTEVASHFSRNFSKNSQLVSKWKKELEDRLSKDKLFKENHQDHFKELECESLPPLDWSAKTSWATRSAFGKILDQWCLQLPRRFYHC